jgi:hypothetical protein
MAARRQVGLNLLRRSIEPCLLHCIDLLKAPSEFVGMLSTDPVEDSVFAGKLVEVVLDPNQIGLSAGFDVADGHTSMNSIQRIFVTDIIWC